MEKKFYVKPETAIYELPKYILADLSDCANSVVTSKGPTGEFTAKNAYLHYVESNTHYYIETTGKLFKYSNNPAGSWDECGWSFGANCTKYCEYNATKAGSILVSSDNGKTWSSFAEVGTSWTGDDYPDCNTSQKPGGGGHGGH